MATREEDKTFILWCIDQYLDGKVSADSLVSTIKAMVPPRQQEQNETMQVALLLTQNSPTVCKQ